METPRTSLNLDPRGRSVPAENFPGPQNRKLWVSVRRFNKSKLVDLSHASSARFRRS